MKMVKFVSLVIFYFTNMNMGVIQAKEINISITSEDKSTVELAMVTLSLFEPKELDQSDNGYPKPQVKNTVDIDITKFSNQKGIVNFSIDDNETRKYKIKVRKFAFRDQIVELNPTQSNKIVKIILKPENDPLNLAAAKKANQWLGAIHFKNEIDKKVFQMQCGFCHQFGTEAIRQDRTIEEWQEIISRMIGYGSRLPTDLQKELPQTLISEFKRIKNDVSILENPLPWQNYLMQTEIKEWPTGDIMSQVHDAIVGTDGIVYAADNIQDRIYAINPKTHEVVVHKIPHREGDQPGGLIAARLQTFPKHDSTSNAHSLAQSKIDGHIFITPSAQQRLIEFIPTTGEFVLHELEEGFYPHTIRMDASDNVWFTLALSNQVAKFDRKTRTFTYIDLPARSLKEKLVTKYIKYLFVLMNWGIPVSKWLKIDRTYSGTPLTYGIDITPDQKVWFTRLHTDEIGFIDPSNLSVTMVKTPLMGPRRLRTDNVGNVWTTFYGDSAIAKYDPKTQLFEKFILPVLPLGSETPYALNYDGKRNWVWVTGNQSDALFALDLNQKIWRTYPLPKTTTFTRDIEFDEEGNAYVCNSNFPSWHVEDGQPTLISINPEL
jgi:virginiamycin B lyase